MSGLVPGLQNQLERFDSASDLQHNSWFPHKSAVFLSLPHPKTKTNYQRQRYRLNFFNFLTAQWKITGGNDYALFPNREWNQKQKT